MAKKASKKTNEKTGTKAGSAWFDGASSALLIAEQAKRLESFLAALADGRIDDAEMQAQEARLVNVMKEVEPLLDEKLHAKVTALLVELTAYDMMQALYAVQQSRPKTKFRG
jgi:hypothetical protein